MKQIVEEEGRKDPTINRYLKLCSRCSVHFFCNFFEIYSTHQVHLPRVNFQDIEAGLKYNWRLILFVKE